MAYDIDCHAFGQIMHFVGRITAPVMCFFITEGYHYTRNFHRYLLRMIIFAFISHFAYSFCFNGGFFDIGTESVIATLTLSLLSVHTVNSDKIPVPLKLPIVLFLAYFAEKCDWGSAAIIFTLSFEFAREYGRKMQVTAYSLSALYYLLPKIAAMIRAPEFIYTNIFNLGVFLPIPLLLLYNGQKGGGKYSKWVFYIFYPVHLILLGLIDLKYG